MKHLEIEDTKRIFRTAYYLAKNNRPYTDHPDLVELQQLNGTDLGVGLHSRYSATEIIDHITFQMRLKICSRILEIEGKIALIIDESTTISNISTLVVYLKCETSKLESPQFMFLDLIELAKQDASTILGTLLNCMESYGFNNHYLSQHLIGFASDGASVMLGRNSGVGTQVAIKYPNIILWHCLNHRLELSVFDTIKRLNYINHFKKFFDKLYTLYSRSPKNQRELRECSSSVCEQVTKIGRMLDTMWVASSFRTVKAVWSSYQSLCKHFDNASQDPERSSTERATFNGMLKRIRSPEFLVDLGLMYDTLYELSALSELLQHRATTIIYADKMIFRTIRRLENLIENGGTKSLEAECARMNLKFNLTTLIPNASIININKVNFLSTLIKFMQARLFTATVADDSSLIKNLQVLSPECWPVEHTPRYGEREIKLLCDRFGLSEIRIVNALCDYYEDLGLNVPTDLKPLLGCIDVTPCSSSECERGFSQMNIILDEKRNRLTIKHVFSLMFIQINGPPLSIWNPTEYTKTWLRHYNSASLCLSLKDKTSAPKKDNIIWKYF